MKNRVLQYTCIVSFGGFTSLLLAWGNYFIIVSFGVLLFCLYRFFVRGAALGSSYSSSATRPKTIIMIGALVLTILNVLPLSTATIYQRVLGNLIIIIGTLPLYIYFLRKGKDIPFLPTYAFTLAIGYGLPILIDEFYNRYSAYAHIIYDTMYTVQQIDRTLLLILMALLTLIVSYYMFPRIIIGRIMPRPSLEWNPVRARLVAIVMVGVGLFFYSITTTVHLSFISTSFAKVLAFLGKDLLSAGVAMLYVLHKQDRLEWSGTLFLYAALILVVFLGALSGGIGIIVGIIMPFILLFLYFNKRIPWLVLFIVVNLIILVNAGKQTYRERIWTDDLQTADVSLAKRVIPLVDTLKLGTRNYKESIRTVSRRVNQFNTFLYVTAVTPEYVPYWGGHTFRVLPWTVVPRFIYPDKPSWIWGQEFGHRYGLIGENDFMTSFNMPGVVELYANFGTLGVVVGMMIFGAIFRAIAELANHEKCGSGMLVLVAFIFGQLFLSHESGFSLTLAGVFYPAIILFLIMKLFVCKTRNVRKRNALRQSILRKA